jgi:hypothetical protein
MALAKAVELADAVMMHTNTDADRANVNAYTVGRSPNGSQSEHPGDERRFKNGFHLSVLSYFKPSRTKNACTHHSLPQVPLPRSCRDFGKIGPWP